MNQGPFPKDVLILIFKHIPPGTIARWRLVSKRWCEIITNEKWYGNMYKQFYVKMMTRYIPEVRVEFAQGFLCIRHLIDLWKSIFMGYTNIERAQIEYLIRKQKLIDIDYLFYNLSDDDEWYNELCTRQGYIALKKGLITMKTCEDYSFVAFRTIREKKELWDKFLKTGQMSYGKIKL